MMTGAAALSSVMFLVRYAHAHAVDLHTIVGGNKQISAPADHAGFNEIAVLRRDGDLEFIFSNHPEKEKRFFLEIGITRHLPVSAHFRHKLVLFGLLLFYTGKVIGFLTPPERSDLFRTQKRR